MKKPDDESFELRVESRAKEAVTLEIPKEVIDSLKKAAASRDMSIEALLKFYIGQGLRQDLSRLFGDRLFETTASVLARHISSEDEVSSILREIQAQSAGTNQP